MVSMAGTFRLAANGLGEAKASVRRWQPGVADLSPETRELRRRRKRYDSSDLLSCDDEFPGRKRKKVSVRQSLAQLPVTLAIADSFDEVDEYVENHLAYPFRAADADISNETHISQPEPVPKPAAAPEQIPGPSDNQLYQTVVAEDISAGPSSPGASSVKVEALARHVVQTRILKPTKYDDKRPAQEWMFAGDGNIDLPLDDLVVSVLTNPVAIKSAPFHRMHAQIIGYRRIWLSIHRIKRTLDPNEPTSREVTTLRLEIQQIRKGNCDYFIQKEIFEQPESVFDTMRGRLFFDEKRVVLGGVRDYVPEIQRCRRLVIIACSTSYHSAVATLQPLEELTDIPVIIELASDFLDRSTPIFRDVCVFISQSGKAADTLNALRYCKKRGALILGITNTVASSICRESHYCVHINAGPEIGMASTKAYTSQFISLVLFALVMSEDRVSQSPRRVENIEGLRKLPEQIRQDLDSEVKALAQQLHGDYRAGVDGEGICRKTGVISISEAVQPYASNIHAHVYFVCSGGNPQSTDDPKYDPGLMLYKSYQLNKMKIVTTSPKKQNLLTGEPTTRVREEEADTVAPLSIMVSHWHPNLTFDLVDNWTQGKAPSPLSDYLEFYAVGNYCPILCLNDYWNLNKNYVPRNDTTKIVCASRAFLLDELTAWDSEYGRLVPAEEYKHNQEDDASDVDELSKLSMGKKAQDTLCDTDVVPWKNINGNAEEICEKPEDINCSRNGPCLITRTGPDMSKQNLRFIVSEDKPNGFSGDFTGTDGFSHSDAYEVDKDEGDCFTDVQMPDVFDEFIQSPVPETQKNLRSGMKTDLKFASCSMQGWRTDMEDFSTAMAQMRHPFEAYSFFGIFDGHKGSGASSHCSEHMVDVLTDTEEFGLLMNSNTPMDNQEDLIVRGLVHGFLQMDDRIRLIPEVLSGHDQSGSTAICALFTPSMIFLANCGDSGAIIVSKGGVKVVTRKHKPTERTEKERIRRAGGKVSRRRVGTLAVSRTLGDFRYKSSTSLGPTEQLVSPEPEVHQWVRNPHDEFIVLASDGVWDVMSGEDVHQFVRSHLLSTDDLELICGELAECCLEKGSRDNISVTIILLVSATSIGTVARVHQQATYQWAEIAVRDLIPIIGDLPIDLVTLSFMARRICARKGQAFLPESTTHARHIIAERAWRAWNPRQPLMQRPANRLEELDMAVVEQYLCMQPKTAISGELCGEVCNRNNVPFASGFTVRRLELDCQTNQAGVIDDNMVLKALQEIAVHIDDNTILTTLPKIAVYTQLYFPVGGESDHHKGSPAIAYFFLPACHGTLRVARVNFCWLATLAETLFRMANSGVLNYKRTVSVKHQNTVVPLHTTFEALGNCDRVAFKHSIFLFLLEE